MLTMNSYQKYKPYLLTLGIGIWLPVIYMKHIKGMPLGFLGILPFLAIHVICMITLFILRFRSTR